MCLANISSGDRVDRTFRNQNLNKHGVCSMILTALPNQRMHTRDEVLTVTAHER